MFYFIWTQRFFCLRRVCPIYLMHLLIFLICSAYPPFPQHVSTTCALYPHHAVSCSTLPSGYTNQTNGSSLPSPISLTDYLNSAPNKKWKPPLKYRQFQNSASFCFTKIYHITVYSSQVILFNGKFPPFQYSFYCSVNTPTTVITWQALTSMTRFMSSGNNTCVLKDLVPALKNSLLHTGGLLSAGQLQRMLAHCRQELENQLSAFRLTSTTFATERRKGGKCLHSSTCQGKSPLPGQPSTL